METIAQFRFVGYQIRKSLFEVENADFISKDLAVNVGLKGEDNQEDSFFNLTMKINVQDKEKNLNVEVVMDAQYEYDKDLSEKDTSNFFYLNAPAILFPYVRAHIATLSTLSGFGKPIHLPTLNLSKEGQRLKENTVAVEK